MSVKQFRQLRQRAYERWVTPIEDWLDRHGGYAPSLQLFPGMFWVFFFLGGALLLVLFYSFLETAPASGDLTFTLSNYVEFFTNNYYRSVFVESFFIAIAVTVISLVLAYPAAYYIAFMDSEYKNIYLLMLILPFWINLIIRTYAWQLILGKKGLINYVLFNILGIVNEPMNLIFSNAAIVLGLVHVFMPFAVIPLYTSLERIDRSHIESSRNLGANRLQTFYEIVLPQNLPGIAASTIIVFVLSFGSFVIPDMLGGTGNVMIGNIIAQMFGRNFDWAFGSAMATVFVVTVVVLVYLFNRTVGLQSLYGDDGA